MTDQFKLLIPADMKARLQAEARRNLRSLSAEIVARLRDSLPAEPAPKAGFQPARPPSCSTCRFYAPTVTWQPGAPRGYCGFRLPIPPRHPLERARFNPYTETCDLHQRPADDRG